MNGTDGPEREAFLPGIIEGFFGRPWTWEDRHALASFMSEQGFPAYIYAPKDDRWLRRDWALPMPREHARRLGTLAEDFRAQGLQFGIGLSPWGLYRDYSDLNRRRLDARLAELARIGPDLLCLQFDDMPGDAAQLADTQAAIMKQVMDAGIADRYLFCPTYYSLDPILETHFGAMPAGYLETLGERLPSRVGIFWTGPKVVSDAYPADHLESVAKRIGRRPVLWDNYPVNDGRAMVDYLHLRPAMVDTTTLLTHCSGHFVNPMNQCWLSRIPLLGLLRRYRGEDSARDRLFAGACRTLCPPALATLLIEDCADFQDRGLQAMSARDRSRFRTRYAPHQGHPCADEILAWLAGEYAFDPACLT